MSTKIITHHAFEPGVNPFLCGRLILPADVDESNRVRDRGGRPCGLAAAAHEKTTAELVTTDVYRCPFCVTFGKTPCPHGRAGALDVNGAPVGPAALGPLDTEVPGPEPQEPEDTPTPIEQRAQQPLGRYRVIAYDWSPPDNEVAAFDDKDAAAEHADRMDGLALRCYVHDTRPQEDE